MNTNVHDCLFLVQEDNSLLYVAGHNIILYKLDEKEQYFMPGKLRLSLENVVDHITETVVVYYRFQGYRGHHTRGYLEEQAVHIGV